MLVYLIPIFLGLAAVLQAGINRQIVPQWSLTGAVLMNVLVLCVTVLAVYGIMRLLPIKIPELFRLQAPTGAFAWWWVLPGILGYLIISGMPFAVMHLGAARVFVAVITAQMISSLLWDYYIEGITATPQRLVGCLLATVGAFVAVWK